LYSAVFVLEELDVHTLWGYSEAIGIKLRASVLDFGYMWLGVAMSGGVFNGYGKESAGCVSECRALYDTCIKMYPDKEKECKETYEECMAECREPEEEEESE